MKFFICGKDLSRSPIATFKRNYPLKWEVVTTHFIVKSLIADKKIDVNKDFVVTVSGREFLYSNQFKNVITWQKYVSHYQNLPDTETEDLVAKWGLSFLRNPFKNDFWMHKKTWLPKIRPYLDLKLPDVSNYSDSPYICISVRKRSVEESHNTDLEMIKQFINYKSGLGKISDQYKIFITGPGSEDFHDGTTTWQVNLEEWTALISSTECEAVITTMDGPCQLARIWSKAKKFIQIDMENINWQANIDNPILMGCPQDFIKSQIILYNSWVGFETLKTVINPTWGNHDVKKVNEKKHLIIDFVSYRTKIGLGDALVFSKIPRLAKQIGGYEKVFISNRNKSRYDDYDKIIWDLNPWADGYTELGGDPLCTNDQFIIDFSKDVNTEVNIVERSIRAHKLFKGNEKAVPEIFYKPKEIKQYKNKNIWDPNYVTSSYGLTKETITDWFTNNNIKIDYQFESDNELVLDNVPVILRKDIFYYADILANAKNVYMCLSGGSMLSSALGKKCTVLLTKLNSNDSVLWKMPNIEYIYLNSDYYFKHVEVLVPQGIGDIFWVYQKLYNYVDSITFNVAVLSHDKIQTRSEGLLKTLPKVDKINFKQVSGETYQELCLMKKSLTQIFSENLEKDNISFSYALNKSLEEGIKLEDIDFLKPATNIKLRSIKPSQEIPVEYLLIYVSGTTDQKSRGEINFIWSWEQWAYLILNTKYSNLPIILIGADFDLNTLREINNRLISAGRTDTLILVGGQPEETIWLLQNATYFIGYQSGLNILADNLGTKQMMLYFDIDLVREMKDTWVNPKHRKNGIFSYSYFSKPPKEIINSINDQTFKLFFTSGIGDFFALERLIGKTFFKNVTEIVFGTKNQSILSSIGKTFFLNKNIVGKTPKEGDMFIEYSDEYLTHIDMSTHVIAPNYNVINLNNNQKTNIEITNNSSYSGNYFVVHPFSTNVKAEWRDLTQDEFDILWNEFISNFDYGIIINKFDNEKDDYLKYPTDKCINLSNKITIEDSMSIISNAKGFFGCSSWVSVWSTNFNMYMFKVKIYKHMHEFLNFYYKNLTLENFFTQS